MRDIWEEFRSALCISGEKHRSPPTLPPPDLTGGGDEGGGGGGGGKGEDRLSALPDDVLLFILSRVQSAAAAARTSVLSRRWRRLWTQLPELWFPLPAEPDCARPTVRSNRWPHLWAHLPALRFRVPTEPARALPSPAAARAALAEHSAPAILNLNIVANDADPGDTAAVLRLAAPRLTGMLFFRNEVPKDRKNGEIAEAVVTDAIELPCFNRTERLHLNLGYLHLALPLLGVFTKLTELVLRQVRFQGTSDIGDTLSSDRCPSLRLLKLFDVQGVSKLSICSESLVSMFLRNVKELQQLSIVSPILRCLSICNCFFMRQPMADITAPVLEWFVWLDQYDPRWVKLGELTQLQSLGTCFAGPWYGSTEHQYNQGIVKLLQRFEKIPALHIAVIYPIKLSYCMEGLTSLLVKKLHLILITGGHAIGSYVFHLLKMSTRIRSLCLDIREAIKEVAACSPDCLCHEEQDWKTEELFFNSLQELDICGFSGSNYDFTFVERLLGWTRVLKSVTINFDPKATVNEELCEELLRCSGPEICMKIYIYRNGAKGMIYCQYLMEALTLLPVIENLHLQLVTSGHAVVSCVFHFLKISTSIRKLIVHISEGIQEQTACSPGCTCHQPQD